MISKWGGNKFSTKRVHTNVFADAIFLSENVIQS